MFDYLALGAIVDGRVLCVHGGLSPNLQSIDQVRGPKGPTFDKGRAAPFAKLPYYKGRFIIDFLTCTDPCH